jgi:hypothetical protein
MTDTSTLVSRTAGAWLRTLMPAVLASAGVATVLTLAFIRWFPSPVSAQTAAAKLAPVEDFLPARPEKEVPPWGELKKVPMVTEKPEEFLDMNSTMSEPVEWKFSGLDEAEVRRRFIAAGLSPQVTSPLFLPPVLKPAADGVEMRPADDYVLQLGADDRRRLYNELRRAGAGHFQVYPFCFPAGKSRGMLKGHVSPETEEMVSRLLYRVGKADCFADVGPVFRSIEDEAERRHLLKALTRQQSLILKAVIRPDTNVDRLINYWSTPSRRKDLQPLLESLTQIPGGVLLDSVHLIPAFARQRLYVYPDKVTTGQHEYDCHWTSLNFMRREADMRFLNSQDVAEALKNEYEVVPMPSRLGDVILFTTDGNNVVHSCVFIADDVVFTKNGANVMQPWIFMTLADMEIVYPSDEPYRMVTYRLKEQ